MCTVIIDCFEIFIDMRPIHIIRITTTVKIPAFTKGKKQLAGIDVEQTRGISNLRIHVEQVIGNLRSKCTFLGDVQPIDYLICKNDEPTILDMAVTVSSCLCNLCDSVVPFD